MVELKNAFVKEFKRCLVSKYGKVPSAARIAKDFTLSSPEGVEPVSVETIRKWLLGINIPQSARMRTLSRWLGFDVSVFDVAFKLSDPPTHNELNTRRKVDREILHLLQSFSELQESERETVLEIVDLYKRSRNMKK
jgi:transcriptional regulator with XRE-family HTH domain